ncbi:RNA polymerase sigma-70 factor, ECF subfamily [Rubritalea squalenifaciens DSM 18772]|uniref:RNA polymerase sigma-70 factor, ECF subfamily n=1 Tax=Rubritalea squalenifaciens DSM 18772 TaxID=1123071 RepID=A0A1M6KLW1_9BACT|nr:sigma-70 family RNA polymerase sigma factor [Rubritalea squalenifaciens]SHJ59854.1 RNA polymerase sigma-70 factor, ECF subfamily [Rubritalea squalenifaciens DSM 18772]
MSSNYEHSPEEQREFISLVTQYQPSLRAYIISLMPGMDGAADVLQETNLIIWEKRKSFEIGTNFVAWAYAIARFEVKRHKRQYSKQKSKVCTLDDDLAEELAEFCSLVPEETEKRMLALERCLSKLKKEELQLIQQRYGSDLSLKDYADKVGRPFGSLRVTLHRIRSGLRQCVAYQLNPSLGSR